MSTEAHQSPTLIALLRRRLAHRLATQASAPARAPLRATRDLGTPFLDVHAPHESPIAAPETEATVHALLARLERDVVRRGLAVPREEAEDAPPIPLTGRLEETLTTLRRMAARR